MLARAVRQSGNNSRNIVGMIIANIVASIIQGAWNLVVFFAIPVLVVEDVGVIRTPLKRSVALFKQTWGEQFTGSMAIGAVSCLATIALFVVAGVLIALAAASQSVILIGITIAESSWASYSSASSAVLSTVSSKLHSTNMPQLATLVS